VQGGCNGGGNGHVKEKELFFNRGKGYGSTHIFGRAVSLRWKNEAWGGTGKKGGGGVFGSEGRGHDLRAGGGKPGL